MLGSSEGFFRSGRTIDCLKMDGKMPVRREELMMEVSAGRRTSRHSTSNGTGRGSRAHDLGAELVMTRLTSSSVTGRKLSKKAFVCPTSLEKGEEGVGVSLSSPSLIVLTLVVKKSAKASGSFSGATKAGKMEFLQLPRRRLLTLNSASVDVQESTFKLQ